MTEPLAPDDVAAFRAGDPALLDGLAAHCAPYLLAVARAYAADDDQAADFVQQAWIRIQQGRATFDGRGSLLGWMLAVCRRTCLAGVRHEKARAAAEAVYVIEDGLDGPGEDTGPGARERASVHAALAALPPRQRDAVILRLLQDRTTRETAAVMGCAEGTVKALLHQGVQNLKRTLGGLW